MASSVLGEQDPALRSLAERAFDELRRLSYDGAGVTRESLGPRETAAHELVAGLAREAGLEASRDRVGNLVVSLAGADAAQPFIATGSHLDSVPCGGNYDGAAGVVAGLLALTALKRGGVVPPRTLKLFALRGEESAWFGTSWIGSHALFGLLSESDLAQPRADDGRSLAACLRDIGADVDAIAARERLLAPESVAAFLEVHIEQGPVLEARGLPLGVVTSIYGNLRHRRVVCRGVAAHAGATPRELRHDAVVASADLIMRVDRQWSDWLARGSRLVVTHGIVGTNEREHAISRVAGESTMSIEIRAEDDETLQAFHGAVQDEARAVAVERGVAFEFDRPIVNRPARMDPGWSARLASLCSEAAIPYLRLPSGAGHDAQMAARFGPMGMIFVPSAGGISHNIEEYTNPADLTAGANVLLRLLLELAE
jgi:N-carbamoyl-L-amino-acid hydrolase